MEYFLVVCNPPHVTMEKFIFAWVIGKSIKGSVGEVPEIFTMEMCIFALLAKLKHKPYLGGGQRQLQC